MALYFNENGELQEYETISDIVTCPKCGKKYRQDKEEQVPGFRDRSYDICPYCGEVNGSSMDVDYFNSRIDK